MLNRRELMLLGGAGLLMPGGLVARPLAGERKFLFIYCKGGWDTLKVFTPMPRTAVIDNDQDSVGAVASGIDFADHAARPQVRQFFEDWGHQAAVVNGIEVRSITHERCRRILLTGSGEGVDDWAVTMSTDTGLYYPLPHLVVTGPAFAGQNGAGVVRAGENGQLAHLLGRSALEASDMEVKHTTNRMARLEEDFLRGRIDRYTAGAGAGGARQFGKNYGAAIDNLGELRNRSEQIELDPEGEGCRRNVAEDARTALTCFELGLSRCAMVQDLGWCSGGWDSHANLMHQDWSYDELFGYLSEIMSDLETRTSVSGQPLKDEVTIVVLSEMGRHPQINSAGGRDHWTYTSAMLLGAGVRGGQSIGGLDGDFIGQKIDLDGGEITDAGTGLLPSHLGATLLTLAGKDPGELGPDSDPIMAVIDP
jgi:uncharacterized protein (DUF1501 family)